MTSLRLSITSDASILSLTESLIKELHVILKSGTAVGEYKRIPNEVGGNEITVPGRCQMRNQSSPEGV